MTDENQTAPENNADGPEFVSLLHFFLGNHYDPLLDTTQSWLFSSHPLSNVSIRNVQSFESGWI